MNGSPTPRFRTAVHVSFFLALFKTLAIGVPTALDDNYSTAEDTPLVITNAPLIDASFEGGGGAINFNGDWSYLDELENQNGANDPYPVDGSGNAWNSTGFNTASSTVGTWLTGAMPLQAGTIDAFPGAPDTLEGLGDASNGENLITTYLFRNTFTLTAAQAAESDWTANALLDDGYVLYINGNEVDRLNLPAGAVTTTTLATTGDENNYLDRPLNLAGLLVAGANTIAIELHQVGTSSSDVGIDLSLSVGGSVSDGFSYLDDFFSTFNPARADGTVAAGEGFINSTALKVEIGRGNFFESGPKSGAWTRDFDLLSPGSVDISFRYRQLNQDALDAGDFTQVILDIDGTRYGNDTDSSVSHLDDGGDTGWQVETRTVSLSAGNHTIALGFFNNASRRDAEFAEVWFDDVVLQFAGGAGGVLSNDIGGNLTAALVTNVSNGTLNGQADGTFIYTPAANFFGTDSFTYRAVDQTGQSNIATATITITPVNDPPTAAPDSYSLVEDTPLSVPAATGVLSNDNDVENQTMNASLATPATHGTVELNANGAFLYTPAVNFFGSDSFSYIAGDGSATSGAVAVSLTVTAADDAPIANPDNYDADENTPLVITESGSGNVIFSTNFDSGAVSELSGGGGLESVGGFSGIGPAGDAFAGQYLRNATGVAGNGIQTPTVLTLTNLPAHTSLSVEFLLAVLDTWDGLENSFSSDYFGIQVDGNTVFSQSFHRFVAEQLYAAPSGGQLVAETDLGGSSGTDSAYDFSLEAALRDIPHTASTATITFFAGGGSWDGGDDESWAMDNLRVSVNNTPRDSLTPRGGSWSYLDDGSDLGTTWRAASFNDSAWASGNAKLGYGDGDETTTIDFGPDDNNKFVTTYFRTSFNVADPSIYSQLLAEILQDDSAAVYLNGTEVIRNNLGANADSGEFATAILPGALESNFFQHSIDASLLVAGTNVLAVEVHQATASSSDMNFDFSIAGVRSRSAGGVLANDIEPDGQAMTVSLLTNASNGNVALDPDGTFTYTPGVNFHGTDSFTYTASDGSSSSSTTVTITVNPGPNDIPEPVADNYNGTEDQTLVVNVANGVLDNDIDPDGDPLTAVLVTPASNGTVTLNANGSFSYVPDANFAGTDTFEYLANDTIDNSAITLVTLNITNVADRPVAMNDVFVAQPNQTLNIAAPGVLDNDSDGDSGTALSAVLASDAQTGTLNLSGDGSFTYNPPAGFGGIATFAYRASDGVLQSASSATVVIQVNARPVAGSNTYSVVEDNVLSVPGPGVLGNDSDPEGTNISAVTLTEPANGTLSLAANGALTYTPDADFSGTDTFTYAANDGLQNSFPRTVTLNVSAVNDPPFSEADNYQVLANATTNISVAEGLLSNDEDVDGPTLTTTAVSLPSSGTLNVAANGSFNYTPAIDFTGVATFTYQATDGTLNSAVTTVTLAVGLAAESIIISEIMYHPASENNAEEFVELFNRGDAPINLAGWQFTSGLSFTFPSIVVPAGSYLVVAADTTTFTAIYGNVPLLVGGWTGGLSNRGERLKLVDATGAESDDLTYSDQGDWALRRSLTDGNEQGWEWFAAHDGEGSSLELINNELTNKRGQNWAPSSGAPTPGAANSVADTDTAPLISGVKHRPAIPTSNDPVTITAKLKDIDGSALSATLFSRTSTTSPGAFASTAMFDDGLHGDGDAGDGEFGTILTPSADGTIIEFYVSASDGGNTRTWPAPTDTGQDANALFQFDNEEFTDHYPIYRTIITAADEERFPFNNRSSNAELNTTFIANNCSDISVRYLSGMRIRGASSRNDTPPPVRVNIVSDDPWDGEVRLNLNTQFTWLQFIGMKFFQAAGLPAPDTKRVASRRNGIDRSEEGEEGFGSIVHVQPLQEEFLDTHISSDAGGNIYKKVRPDNGWAYRNGDVDAYLGDGWSKPTNASENDWSDLDEWLRVMNQAQNDADYIAQVEVVANLDQWMQWFAVMTILNNGETNASNGTDDDYSIYRGVTDPRFIFIPHDLDTILGQGDGSAISDPESTIFDMIDRGDILPPLVPLFADAGILDRYHMALREQLQTTFSVEQFDALLDNHLTGWVPQDRIDELKTYMNTRRAFITGLVDARLGAPPALTPGTTSATLTSAHGGLFINEVLANNTSAYNISGLFPDAIELRNTGGSAVNLSGMSLSDDPLLPTRYTFPAGSSIAANGTFVIDSNTLGFAFGSGGDSVILYNSGGTQLDSVTFGTQIANLSISRTGTNANTWALTNPTIGAANAAPLTLGNPDNLKINEWLVRPQVTFDRDFVELYNPETQPVALGGLVITDEPVADPQRHSLPPLSYVGASNFTLFYPVGSDSANAPDELPYKLSADHGWLSISGINGIEIDEIHYICQRNDIAFGRETDGAAIIVDFDLPTPGFSNATDLSAESLLLESLRITEIMYHPANGDLEFLRLKNIGTATINLGGISISNGVSIDLPASNLAPGESAVIVRDQAAYEAEFGATGVLGQYTGALSNGGERLRLEISGLGYGILDFDYNDSWYAITDGLGASLGIVDENAERNTWGEKESWQPLGGDTSSYDSWAATNYNSNDPALIDRSADPDNDGINNAAEYALGLDPNSGNRGDLLGVAIEGNFLTLTYPRSKAANASWEIQAAGDVEHWQTGPSEVMLSDDGTIEIWKATDSIPITAERKRFMRVKITVP